MTIATDVLVRAEEVMGTVFSFAVYCGAGSRSGVEEAIDRSCARLHDIDDCFSFWNPASPMSEFRAGHRSLDEAPAEIAVVLELCRQARELSLGLFDPWAMPGGVDPTGLVKGWAVGQALQILRQSGADAALVNGGGDVAVFGRPPGAAAWRVGIRHPWRTDSLAGAVGVDSAIATSGVYERGLHLVDPRTGQPTSAVASATVTGPSIAMADALATAVAVGRIEALAIIEAIVGYEAYLIGSDGSEAETEGFTFA